MANLLLDINGFVIDLHVRSVDFKHALFFYDHLLTVHNSNPDASVMLWCNGKHESFFSSFLDNDAREKHWYYENLQSGFSNLSSFQDWDSYPSFIPPFIDKHFSTKISVYSGTTVIKEDRCILIIGENYTGKTSLMRCLVNLYGWSLLSDSLVMIENESGKCIPYHSPIGLRGSAKKNFETLYESKSLDTRLTLSVDTGPVLLVRPLDAVKSISKTPTRLTEIVLLTRKSLLPHVPNIHVNIPWFGACPPLHSVPSSAKMFSINHYTITRIAQEINNE